MCQCFFIFIVGVQQIVPYKNDFVDSRFPFLFSLPKIFCSYSCKQRPKPIHRSTVVAEFSVLLFFFLLIVMPKIFGRFLENFLRFVKTNGVETDQGISKTHRKKSSRSKCIRRSATTYQSRC